MSSLTIPTPFVKHGLLYIELRISGRRRCVRCTPFGPGANGDISLKPGETSNDYIAWSQPLLGTYNTSALVYGDYYYTLLDRGFLLCHDARTGKQIYGRTAHLGRVERLHRVAVGLQRKDLRPERGWRHVRDAGRARVQAARQELAERDVDGDAGVAAREPDPPHQVSLYRIARQAAECRHQ